jgi:hypothetical protein
MGTQPCYSEALCLESGQEERLSCVLFSGPPEKQAFVYISRYFFLYSFIFMFVYLLSSSVVLYRLPFVLTLPPRLLFSIILSFLYVRIIFSQFRSLYLFHFIFYFSLLMSFFSPFPVYSVVSCSVSARRIYTPYVTEVDICLLCRTTNNNAMCQFAG